MLLLQLGIPLLERLQLRDLTRRARPRMIPSRTSFRHFDNMKG